MPLGLLAVQRPCKISHGIKPPLTLLKGTTLYSSPEACMYFEQFYLSCLAHASYMIGSEGVATVDDPQRDVDLYLDPANKNGLRIQHVIETHLHADFVSGHHELAARTGAKIYLGAHAGAAFPHVAVRDGDEINFG